MPMNIRDLPLRDVSPENIAELRAILATRPEGRRASDAMERINQLLDAHGVEAIYASGGHSGYWQNIVAVYVNMGDSYTATVLYDVGRSRFIITDGAAWVEWYEATHEQLP